MTTPIKPMSAEEAIEDIRNALKASITPIPQRILDRQIAQALASHLAYVMEKLPDNDRDIHCLDCNGLDIAHAVLQSEIDKLTK